jgi:hypothetical protein
MKRLTASTSSAWCPIDDTWLLFTWHAGNNSTIFLVPRANPRLCVSYNESNSITITLQECSEGPGHVWHLSSDGLVKSFTKRCLTAEGSPVVTGGNYITLRDCLDSENQQQLWVFDYAHNHMKPLSAPWLCLTALQLNAGFSPYLWPCSNLMNVAQNSQNWLWMPKQE